jgi:MerR family transcriptional regulator, copper efflux regulator
MTNPIYTEADLLKRCGVSAADFAEFRKRDLISPIMNNGTGTELYPTQTLEVLEKIKQLKSMGYNAEDIRKIVKRVGLPVPKKRKTDDESKTYLTVGELAEKIGVNARTIKHWEDKGIIFPDARSDGGFRLYQEVYVFFGKLIRDLQMFGYTLDEIKTVSDMFRDFVTINNKPDAYPAAERIQKLADMQRQIETLQAKMNALKEGINRWEDLLKKKRKEINTLITRDQKKK